MALSEDTPRKYELGDINVLPMYRSATIYEGSAVGLTSGYARALVAGDEFQGFAIEKAVNPVASDGAASVKVRDKGKMQITLASVAPTNVGDSVYMSDDGTFTLDSSGNSLIGKVHRYVAGNTCVIEFKSYNH